MENKRDQSFDILAGICIIHMIFYHCTQYANMYEEYQYLLTYLFFFMPFFFFKSGSFHKNKPNKAFIKKAFNRLIIPFIIFSILGHIIYCIRIYITKGDNNIIHYTLSPIKQLFISGSISGNLALWFLLSLFLCKIIFNSCQNLYNKHNTEIFDWLLCISGLLISFCCHYYNFSTPLWIANTTSGLFFYILGYKTKKENFNKFIIPFAIIYIYLCFFGFHTIGMRTNKLTNGYYIFGIITSFTSIILFKYISQYIPKPLNNIFSYIGQHSMVFYVWHWINFSIIITIFHIFKIDLIGTTKLIFICTFQLITLTFYKWLMDRKFIKKYITL